MVTYFYQLKYLANSTRGSFNLTRDDAVSDEGPDGGVHAAAGRTDVDNGQVHPELCFVDRRLLRAIPEIILFINNE